MKILITGCNGNIGRLLTKFFLEKDYEVYGIDNKSAGTTSDFYFIKDKYHSISALKKIPKNIDLIFHLAGTNDIQDCENDPLGSNKNNVLHLSHFLENLKSLTYSKLIYFSSTLLNSEFENIYTTTKKKAETLLVNHSKKSGNGLLIFRIGSVTNTIHNPNSFLTKVLQEVISDKRITRRGTGEEIRSFITSPLLFQLIDNYILHSSDLKSGVYLVDTNLKFRVRYILNLILNFFDYNIDIVYSKENFYSEEDYNLTPFPTIFLESDESLQEIIKQSYLKLYNEWKSEK